MTAAGCSGLDLEVSMEDTREAARHWLVRAPVQCPERPAQGTTHSSPWPTTRPQRRTWGF